MRLKKPTTCVVLALLLAFAGQSGLRAADGKDSTAGNNSTAAPSQGAASAAPAASKAGAQNDEVTKLKQMLEAQQQEIERLRQTMEAQSRLLERLSSPPPATTAESKSPSAVAAPAIAGLPAIGEVASTTPIVPLAKTEAKPDLEVGGAPTAAVLSSGGPHGPSGDSDEGPDAIHYKGITLTPGGFLAAESVVRQRATSSDINTPFNSIPYPGNALANISESNFTGRQSRASMLAESKIGETKLTGYYEADWLGTGVTSNNRQSNSYVLRQRQVWGQAALDNGWSFTGGQMWSLATEDKKGIQNRQEAIPMTIDPQYLVGFTWARQYGFRVVKDFGGKFALAASIEGPQATIGGRGFSTVTTTTVGSASVATTSNTFLDAPGAGGGLFNFADTTGYSINKSPDIILKAAWDPGWGHYELFGILSTFRNRVYPCGVVGTNANDTAPPSTTTTIPCSINGSVTPSAVGAFNDTETGGGLGASLRIPVVKHKLDFALKAVGGDGIGRYGSAQLPDLTFKPDGSEALIRTGHANAQFEWHANKKLDVYGAFGGEYAFRDAYKGYDSITVTKTPAIPATATTLAIPATTTTSIKLNQIGGYGSPFANNTGCSTQAPPSNDLTPSSGGTCAGDTRVIFEGTLGWWNKIYEGRKGGLRWGVQYSYLTRTGWSGNNNVLTAIGVSPRAVDNMVLTSFRYYIP